jgi:lysophospholipase L1-like esterase
VPKRHRRVLLGALVAAGIAFFAGAPTIQAAAPPKDPEAPKWVGAWGAAPTNANYAPAAMQSFRMVVRPTIAGEAIRLRFSNAYGESPVELASVQVARRTTGAALAPGTARRATFSGQNDVTIPPHGVAVSDPVAVDYRFGDDLAVSFFVPAFTPQVTGHGAVNGVVTSYATPPGSGDLTDDTTGSAFSETTTLVYFLAGMDALVRGALGTVVTFGDSITDGSYSTVDGHDTYPEVLAQRLHDAGIKVGVVNQGIPGNTLLPCPAEAVFGDAGVDRFDRDVLAIPNVRAVIIKEGGNDLRFCPTTEVDIERALQSLVDRSRAVGVAAVVGTYVPRVSRTVVYATNDAPDEAGDDQRQALNTWIRAHSRLFDGIIDFDATVRDPANPNRLRPDFDSGDGVHPNGKGYTAMAEGVSLETLKRQLRSTRG